ncbi:MAG TPA: DUF1697 domain-containing protein [Pseudolabrys sp.]|nr:DUF1697 domain-containing protein [Pseudolabrys sp.]
MTCYVAFLRAVNVGGKTLPMATLRDYAQALGLGNPRTLLQSGNLVFTADGTTVAKLEALLEARAEKRLGSKIECMVRSARELAAIIAKNPFPAEAKRDPAHLLVMVLKDKPGAAAVTALRAAIKGRETVAAAGRELYIVYPDGIGRSKLTVALIEKTLARRGTGRNWNTLLKLATLTEE